MLEILLLLYFRVKINYNYNIEYYDFRGERIMGLFWGNRNKSKNQQKAEYVNSNKVKCLDNNAQIIVGNFMNEVCRRYYSQSMEVKASLRSILNKKLERASYDETQYIDTLKRNILYYLNTLEDERNLIKSWINNGSIPPMEQCISVIDNLQKKYKGSNPCINKQNTAKLKVYDDLFPITHRIEQLEFDYMYFNIFSESTFKLLQIILSNQQLFLKLHNSNPDLVIDKINFYLHDAASNCLGTLKIDLKSEAEIARKLKK